MNGFEEWFKEYFEKEWKGHPDSGLFDVYSKIISEAAWQAATLVAQCELERLRTQNQRLKSQIGIVVSESSAEVVGCTFKNA